MNPAKVILENGLGGAEKYFMFVSLKKASSPCAVRVKVSSQFCVRASTVQLTWTWTSRVLSIDTSSKAVCGELQVPRSLPRVGDAAKWIATGPKRVYGE